MLIDSTGNVKSVVIGVGGFLDMGEQDGAIPMERLDFPETAENGSATTGSSVAPRTTGPDHATVSAAKEQLKAMPAFEPPSDA